MQMGWRHLYQHFWQSKIHTRCGNKIPSPEIQSSLQQKLLKLDSYINCFFADKKGIIYSQKIHILQNTGIKSYIYIYVNSFFSFCLSKSIFGLFFSWPWMSETLFSHLHKSFVWPDNQCFLLHQLESLKQPSTAICHNA